MDGGYGSATKTTMTPDRARDVSKRRPSSSLPTDPLDLIPRWLVIGIIVTVMFMWVGSLLLSAVRADWPVPSSVHALVILVVTAVMGYVTVKKK